MNSGQGDEWRFERDYSRDIVFLLHQNYGVQSKN